MTQQEKPTVQRLLQRMEEYAREIANEHGLTLHTIMGLQQKYQDLEKELEVARTYQFNSFIQALNSTVMKGYDEELGADAAPVVRSFALSVIIQTINLVQKEYTDPYDILDRIVGPS